MTLPKKASNGTKSGSDGCFYCFSNGRRACFSLSMQSIDPTKLRIFFGISSLFPSFLIGRGQGMSFLCLVQEGEICCMREDEEGVCEGTCCCKLLMQSVLCDIYYGLGCA